MNVERFQRWSAAARSVLLPIQLRLRGKRSTTAGKPSVHPGLTEWFFQRRFQLLDTWTKLKAKLAEEHRTLMADMAQCVRRWNVFLADHVDDVVLQ